MPEEYDNELRGVLFKNDKEGIESRADYRGSATIERAEYYVDAWVNTSKKGDKFMSLRFKRKDVARAQGGRTAPPKPAKPDFNDEIPF
jgi:hypothetical protein